MLGLRLPRTISERCQAQNNNVAPDEDASCLSWNSLSDAGGGGGQHLHLDEALIKEQPHKEEKLKRFIYVR